MFIEKEVIECMDDDLQELFKNISIGREVLTDEYEE